MSNSYFDTKILTRIRLHNDKDTCMVSLIKLVGLCFVVYNKDYDNTTNYNIHTDDRTSYIAEPMKQWGDSFLPMI